MATIRKAFHRQRMIEWDKYDFAADGDKIGAAISAKVTGYNIPTEYFDVYDSCKIHPSLMGLRNPTEVLIQDLKNLRRIHALMYPSKNSERESKFGELDERAQVDHVFFNDKKDDLQNACERLKRWRDLEKEVMKTAYDLLPLRKLLRLISRARELTSKVEGEDGKPGPKEGIQLKSGDTLGVDGSTLRDDASSIAASSIQWSGAETEIAASLPDADLAKEQYYTIVEALRLYIRLHTYRGREHYGVKLGTVFPKDHWQSLLWQLISEYIRNGPLPPTMHKLYIAVDLYARLEADGKYYQEAVKLIKFEDPDVLKITQRFWGLRISVCARE